jgi:hypothetical protein
VKPGRSRISGSYSYHRRAEITPKTLKELEQKFVLDQKRKGGEMTDAGKITTGKDGFAAVEERRPVAVTAEDLMPVLNLVAAAAALTSWWRWRETS